MGRTHLCTPARIEHPLKGCAYGACALHLIAATGQPTCQAACIARAPAHLYISCLGFLGWPGGY